MKEQTESSKHQALLIALQRGVPLVRRPWAAIAGSVGMSEADVLQAGQDLFKRGVARRFGAVFDSRSLGYASTLCAVDVPSSDIEHAAALLHPHSGITHCYEREGNPNLWFTLTAPASKLGSELTRIGNLLKPFPVLNLPAIRRFKVEVVLDAAAGDVKPARSETIPVAASGDAPPAFTEREKALIRRIQNNLPLVEEPLTAVAQELQWDTDDLLQKLSAWALAGILRRIGFILRHRAAGFTSNGMCVWPVAEGDVPRAGRILSAAPEVTHCYERPSSPAIPFNLYAMIHARERATAENTFHRLSESAGLNGGHMLISVREFKKTSPVFFLEENP
ncbi:MAG: hypothetical protein WCN95_16500 [bacterium]